MTRFYVLIHVSVRLQAFGGDAACDDGVVVPSGVPADSGDAAAGPSPRRVAVAARRMIPRSAGRLAAPAPFPPAARRGIAAPIGRPYAAVRIVLQAKADVNFPLTQAS
jgi:hypothetical protein